MHVEINPKDWEGKTIKRVVADAINVTRFYFTDGTALAIEVDAFGHGLYGMVQCPECVKPEKAA
jgi:hypothetical protein